MDQDLEPCRQRQVDLGEASLDFNMVPGHPVNIAMRDPAFKKTVCVYVCVYTNVYTGAQKCVHT